MRVKVLSLVSSTNQYLLNLINNLRSGDSCVAEYQYAGRGRRGRYWVSPFGANLYLSMFWRLNNGYNTTTGLSIVVSIVIAELLREFSTADIKVKWPNDVYLYNKKLAGILVEIIRKEGKVVNIVIGIGINLFMHSVTNVFNDNWISLQAINININRNELAILVLQRLYNTLINFENSGLDFFIKRWQNVDYFMNKPVALLIGKNKIYGVAHGIDINGALLISTQGKILSLINDKISLRAV